VLFVLPLGALGETNNNAVLKVTLCDLVRSPTAFNGKLISVRAPVQIAFENFGLSVSNCAEAKVVFIWLEYGRGPNKQPTTWCCGDMVPRDPLTLTQGSEFHRFHRLLTAEKRATGCHDCYLYHVTANYRWQI
jgi:hypothetical protein